MGPGGMRGENSMQDRRSVGDHRVNTTLDTSCPMAKNRSTTRPETALSVSFTERDNRVPATLNIFPPRNRKKVTHLELLMKLPLGSGGCNSQRRGATPQSTTSAYA